MSEVVKKLDVGFMPEAAISGAVLLQSEHSAYLIFNAMKPVIGSSRYKDAGLAICRFPGFSITKFGYPNDEAWSSIPRTQGLEYGIYEVLNSEWAQEITRLNRYAFPNTPDSRGRHYLILFHDSSFECIAGEIQSELTDKPLLDVLNGLSQRIATE